ncbi:MAG: branched-chain amino acid ABC transporter permease [Alphaproteobacteria bacterium]|nr:branched-chain amino acid ABC transporter permease [Alphaproteobacteria bacterium]
MRGGRDTRLLLYLPLAAAAAAPFFLSDYFQHMAVQIAIWSLVYTAWALMGRFRLTSLGHGAFLGVGAYVPTLLWNNYGVTPWLGIPLAMALAIALALIVGYPSSRQKVVGHYFALVTLALGQVVLLVIVAMRDVTGGSLGMTPHTVGHSWYALQLPNKAEFYAVALVAWLAGLVAWRYVERGMIRLALESIAEDEDAAESAGVDVLREKLKITAVSSGLTALGGALYAQYLMYLSPDAMSGVGISLQIVFAAIAGGMYNMLGPTIGAAFTILLTEGLRVLFGTHFVGAANTIYGALLVIFIIFMPRGIVGLAERILARPRVPPAPAAPEPAE